MLKKVFKIVGFICLFFVGLLLLLFIYIRFVINPAIPKHDAALFDKVVPTKISDSCFIYKKNWLHKNQYGIWEEYVEGAPFERGVIIGKLNKELLRQQEEAFVKQIKVLIPNEKYLSFLRYFIRFFNRHLFENIPEEYLQEIYGESLSAPHEYDFIGPAYERMTNYHAAHDIGHALQSLAMVGCTSFAAWDTKTNDSLLIVGRNFDFYSGDEFAKNKIVLFCNPTTGNKFMLYTWPGMIGCVSGMNDVGLTITINAAKSDIPTDAATPISILAREILQYATTIDEAFAIAKKRKTFVAESLLIAASKNHKAAIIEKSPANIALYETSADSILCTNHYQSAAFEKDENNIENINTSASKYRLERLQNLVAENKKLDVQAVVNILRDQKGLDNRNIGMGNEKALNQLIAFHSVVFVPEKKLVYLSTPPFQLGEYLCYDLNKIFDKNFVFDATKPVFDVQHTIQKDSFLVTENWIKFQQFKQTVYAVKDKIKGKDKLPFTENEINQFIQCNPEYYYTYVVVGDYFYSKNDMIAAKKYYDIALTKEVNSVDERNHILEKINEK